MDEKQFCANLEAQKNLVHNSLRQAEIALLGMKNGRKVLDQCAQQITWAINSSLKLSTEKSKSSEKRKAWWNEDCRKALATMRQKQKYLVLDSAAGIENPNSVEISNEARIKLRKTVKKAKQIYYQNVIDRLDHKKFFRQLNGLQQLDNIQLLLFKGKMVL